jgi:hypothetical protein
MSSRKNFHLLEKLDVKSPSDSHEFGLHIHWGDSNEQYSSEKMGLHSLPVELLRREMEEGVESCVELGFRPTSFRGGGLCQTTVALQLIHEHGFTVDSSVAPRLNETERWFQGHAAVPYRSWYFPSKKGYAIPAPSIEDRIGILEIPVTRMIPSFRSWSPYTLAPMSPFLFKVITRQWEFKSRWEKPLIVTPILHSWGDWKVRIGERSFDQFLERSSRMIEHILKRRFKPQTLAEAYSVVCETCNIPQVEM